MITRFRLARGFVLACALTLALAAAGSPLSPRPPAVQAREPLPSLDSTHEATPGLHPGISAAALQASLPEFFTDDEAVETQMRQLQIYYRQNSIEDIWAMHMAPVLAPADGTARIQEEPPYTPEQLEAFRAELDGFVADLADLLEYLPDDRVLDSDDRVEQTRQFIAIASEEQLTEAKELYDQYPGYLETPSYVLGVLQGDVTLERPRGIMPTSWLVPPGQPNVVFPVPEEEIPQYPNCMLYGGHGIGDNGTCEGCPKAPAGSISTVFALETAAFVNGAICEYIPKSLMIINTTIQNPFSLLCTALRAGFEIAAASVKFANELNSECEGRYHRGILHAYLDAEVSTRASQASFDFYSARSLRLNMEDNLLDVLDDRVSTYQLPHSQLGYLDAVDDISVRYVVTDTIHMQELAGYTGEIHNAEAEYTAAEALRLAGDYKSAYARYRKAYRAAVRVGREP